jgi:hypothetical protein
MPDRSQVCRPMLGTPIESFASLGPILGCARLESGHFFVRAPDLPQRNLAKKIMTVELEDGSVLAMMISASRVFGPVPGRHTNDKGRRSDEWSWS